MISNFKEDQSYLVAVWGKQPCKVIEKRGFKTEDGARRFAGNRSKEDNIYYCALLIRDDSNREWPWRSIERIQSQDKDNKNEK